MRFGHKKEYARLYFLGALFWRRRGLRDLPRGFSVGISSRAAPRAKARRRNTSRSPSVKLWSLLRSRKTCAETMFGSFPMVLIYHKVLFLSTFICKIHLPKRGASFACTLS
jgi:hypothetical protein